MPSPRETMEELQERIANPDEEALDKPKKTLTKDYTSMEAKGDPPTKVQELLDEFEKRWENTRRFHENYVQPLIDAYRDELGASEEEAEEQAENLMNYVWREYHDRFRTRSIAEQIIRENSDEKVPLDDRPDPSKLPDKKISSDPDKVYG